MGELLFNGTFNNSLTIDSTTIYSSKAVVCYGVLRSNGTLKFLKKGFEGGNYSGGKAIVSSPNGEMYLGIQFHDSCFIEINGIQNWFYETGDGKFIIAKSDAAGNIKWGLTTTGNSWDNFIEYLDVSSDGSLYATGFYSWENTFTDTTFYAPGGCCAWHDIFISRIKDPVITSSKPFKQDDLINLYPNPLRHESELRIDLHKLEKGEFSIYNNEGRLNGTSLLINSSSIDVSSYSSGIYYYRFTTETGKTESGKLIIQ